MERIPKNLEEIEKQEPQVEDLDFFTLQFMKEHIEMPEIVDFDPSIKLREIQKTIAELPAEEQSAKRFALMADYKKRLKKLRENMTQAQLDLEKVLRAKPEATLEELLAEVTKVVSKNNVSSQAEYFNQAVKSYFEAHESIRSAIQDYKTRFPDNWEKELFADLFGQYPSGKIEIEVMSSNIFMRIEDIKDYVLAYTSSSAERMSESTARSSGGAALTGIEFKKVERLSGKVFIENASIISRGDSERRVKPHEEEHLIHRNIYPRSAFIKGERGWLKELDRRDKQIPFSKLKTVMEGSIHNILVGDWKYRAKTEILAYIKNSENIDYIRRLLTDPQGLYYFVLNRREYYQDWFLGHMKRWAMLGPDNQPLTDEEIRKMYSDALDEAWHKKYLPMLERAIEAVKKMLEIYGKDKYPEIMRLLAQEPIDKWPRLARILS